MIQIGSNSLRTSSRRWSLAMRRTLAVAALLLIVFVVPSTQVRAGTITDTLGSAGPGYYSVLGVGASNQIFASNVTINGNVGVGPGGNLNMMAPSTVNGTVFRDSTATVTGPGPITGGVIVQSLLSTVNAANSASTTFAGLGTTQTFGNISNATTIHGNGGTNVINVTGNITNSLIFSGTASDQFIVNIHGNVNLTGNTSLGTGVSASQVVFNIVGAHTVQTDVGNLVNGIVLATDISSSMTLDGSFSGELIGNNITLMSGAHVTDIQVQSVPEPSSMLLMAFGSIGMGVLLRRKLGRRTFELGQA